MYRIRDTVTAALIKATARESSTFVVPLRKGPMPTRHRHKEQDIKCSEVTLTIGMCEVSQEDFRGN